MKKLFKDVEKIKNDISTLTKDAKKKGSSLKIEDLEGLNCELNRIKRQVKAQHEFELQGEKVLEKIDDISLSLQDALNYKPKR